jgi:hypothetical protein
MNAITKVIPVEGKHVEFPRLSLEELFSISDQIAASNEAIARKLAVEESLAKVEQFNIIFDIRSNKPGVSTILGACETPQVAAMLLRKSLAKSGVGEAEQTEIISKINIPTCVETARYLVLDVQEQKEDKEKAIAEAIKEQVLEESPLPDPRSILEESLKAKAIGYGSGKITKNPKK